MIASSPQRPNNLALPILPSTLCCCFVKPHSSVAKSNETPLFGRTSDFDPERKAEKTRLRWRQIVINVKLAVNIVEEVLRRDRR